MITATTIATIDNSGICTYAHAANIIWYIVIFYQNMLITMLVSGISIIKARNLKSSPR